MTAEIKNQSHYVQALAEIYLQRCARNPQFQEIAPLEKVVGFFMSCVGLLDKIPQLDNPYKSNAKKLLRNPVQISFSSTAAYEIAISNSKNPALTEEDLTSRLRAVTVNTFEKLNEILSSSTKEEVSALLNTNITKLELQSAKEDSVEFKSAQKKR